VRVGYQGMFAGYQVMFVGLFHLVLWTLVHSNSYAVIFYACKSSLELRFAQLKPIKLKGDDTGCIFLAQHIACHTMHATQNIVD